MSFTFVLHSGVTVVCGELGVAAAAHLAAARQTETNIDWLRLRRQAARDAVALREEAALRLMEEGELDAAVALLVGPDIHGPGS